MKEMVIDVSKHLCREQDVLACKFNDTDCSMLSQLEKIGFLRNIGDKVFVGIKHKTLQNPRHIRKGSFIVKNMFGKVFYPSCNGEY